jgi:CFEM domain
MNLRSLTLWFSFRDRNSSRVSWIGNSGSRDYLNIKGNRVQLSGRVMLHSSYCGALLTFFIFTILPFGQGQSVFSLPQCVQNCISQSQDDNCQITDIKCLCRASSAGNFLPGLITCTHAECDNTFDNDLLLTPLQLVCEIAGIPIPASALANAENQASSLASQPTVTVTVGSPSATTISGADTTASESSSLSTVTVTKTQSGSTIYEVYTTTIDSRGSTVTQKTTYTETATASAHISSSTTNSHSTTLTTTTVAGAKTSSSSTAKSRTTTAPSPDSTNSAPFKNTNGNSAVRREVLGSWLGLSILISFGFIWH